MIGLSEEVLKELPDQIVDYMTANRIKPAPPVELVPMSQIGVVDNAGKKMEEALA